MKKNNIDNHPTIFFHVGTGKTGTTFLQYRVFPFLKNIHYVQRTKYKYASSILEKKEHNNYLISREFDQQLEHEITLFSKKQPNTTPIIVFRRHDNYIASQYRRFVKNGFSGNFSNFFNLETDTGIFKKKDLVYVNQIKVLETYFTQKPIVLLYDDLKNDPKSFIINLSKRLKATIDLSNVNLNKKHTSYSEKQLKIIRQISKHVNLKRKKYFDTKVFQISYRILLDVLRYTILFTAKFIPVKFISENPLIAQEELDNIKAYYQKDWEACLKYSKEN